MLRPRLKTILKGFTIFLTLVIIAAFAGGAYSFMTLEQEMIQKLESKKFLVPTEFYGMPPMYSVREIYPVKKIEEGLLRQNYRRRQFDQRLLAGDYFIGNRAECAARLQIPLEPTETNCIGWVPSHIPTEKSDTSLQVAITQEDGLITQIFKGNQAEPQLTGESPLIAQYIGIEPLKQRTVSLGEFPPQCLNAIMSIEDAQFLEHGGVSIKAIGRAFIKNITSGRTAQGGSTITQQLVKNYFLSSERTLKRKFNEFIMSILLESRFSKDQILETYLNVIYMGQDGVFQVRGYGAASRYYFSKDVGDLNLSECSLLAAIVNSPGLFNPFRKPVNAERRRHLVLTKMRDLNFITPEQMQSADQEPLPSAPRTYAAETAPYYLDAVRKQLQGVGVNPDGMKIFTALDLPAQEAAQKSLTDHIENLEKNNKHIKTLREKKELLEGAVLVGDNRTGLVIAAVGGRNYKMTQFNRAIDGHRQVGSVMKPFVYLTALLSRDEEGRHYSPLTLVKDEKFKYKFDRQTWSPDNYGKKYFGMVPMFYALKNSLNSATASLGLQVGLANIVEVTHLMGVKSELKERPAITLGAYEMYPQEVLQSYMTLSRFGMRPQLSFVREVFDSSGDLVFAHAPDPDPTVEPIATAELVSMMKQTVLSGTARYVTLSGFTHPAAGKTGTTSDNRDAWFAGFTPYLTTVVWLGYDSNKPHKLTGSSGAVPVWTSFMKKIGTRFPPTDFEWPEGTEKKELNEEDLRALNALQLEFDPLKVELIIRKED